MELVLKPEVAYAELPNAGDETLDWNLAQIGLDPQTTRYRLVELPLSVFGDEFCSAEAYLLDGDEDSYTRTLALADILEEGGELDAVVACDRNGYYRARGWLDGLSDERLLLVFDGCHRLCAHALASRKRVRVYELIQPPFGASAAAACPGPDCPECSGEACKLCGAGIWRWPVMEGRPPCEHDSVERHTDPE